MKGYKANSCLMNQVYLLKNFTSQNSKRKDFKYPGFISDRYKGFKRGSNEGYDGLLIIQVTVLSDFEN
jgi:hypothetical protein